MNKSMLNKIFGILLLQSIFHFSIAASSLNGNYTINASGSGRDNFLTIGDAVNALYTYGISGPVSFDIVGTFNEQIDLNGAISGSSKFNPITFQASSFGNGVIQFTPTLPTNNFIIRIVNAQYINFNNLAIFIDHQPGDEGNIVYSDRPQGNITFEGNQFKGIHNASFGSSNSAIVYIKALNSSENINKFSFINNEFINGTYGLFLDSHTSNLSNNLLISGNDFLTQYQSIFIRNFNSPDILSNIVSNDSDEFAIYLENCTNNFVVSNNKIASQNNSSSGIKLINCNSGSSRGRIINNFVQTLNSGIALDASSSIDIFYNSINIQDISNTTDTQSSAIKVLNTCNDLLLLNNIFANKRNGYAFDGGISNGTQLDNSNYNCFFTTGTNLFKWNNSDFTSLTNYVNNSGTNFEQNSIEQDPNFNSITDLHTNSQFVNNAGTHITYVPAIDIDNELRSLVTPCIGADEFKVPLSGSYTIGISGDFPTINSAIDSLYSLGIEGPVIFNILNGTYTEQLFLFGNIEGSSSTNIITFQSNSGNAEDVEIYFSNDTITGSDQNQLLSLKYIDNIKFKRLTFSGDGNIGEICEINASNIEFDGNIFESDRRALYFYGVTNQDIYVKNNLFTGGSLTGSLLTNLFLIGNLFNNNNYKSLEINSVNNVEITDNVINGGSVVIDQSSNINVSSNIIDENSSFEYAFEILHCTGGLTFSKNIITGNQSSLKIFNYNDTQQTKGKIYNNFISSNSTGLAIWGSHDIDVFFNSIISKDRGSVLNIWDYGSNDWNSRLNIKNNHIVSTPLFIGPLIAITDDLGNLNLDYNNYYAGNLGGSTGFEVNVNGTEFTSLQEYQATTSFDQHSYNAAVTFVDDTNDLHISSYNFTDLLLGINIAEIDTDIDGETRRNPPFVGADEPPPPPSPLNGSYTVGIGGDYNTILEAISDMYLVGTDGNIIFNILDGIYEEQIDLTVDIPSINPPCIVTFQSSSNDPSKVTLTHASLASDDNFVLRLDNINNIKIKYLTLSADGTDFSRVVQLLNRTNNIELSGNILTRSQPFPQGAANEDGRIINADNNSNLDNCIISNNKIENGTYGFRHLASIGDSTVNLEILGNTFLNNDANLYLKELDSPIISNNFIDGSYLFIADIYNSITIEKNNFHNDGNCLVLSNVHCNSVTKGKIINNFIRSGSRGLGLSNVENVDVFYNTINSDSEAIKLIGTDNTNISMYNNIFYSSNEGYAFVWEGGTNIISDYNNLFTNGDFIGKFGSTDIETFEDFKTQTGAERNSYNELVNFISDTDLHIYSPDITLTGIELRGVNTDYDDDSRNIPPFIGADEPIFTSFNIVLKVFLEGPYNSGTNNMNSLLTVPTTSPFSEYPKEVGRVASNVVDWVLVKIVDQNDQSIVVSAQSAFLLEDGSIVDADDLTELEFNVIPNSYFVVIEHRNHLSTMSGRAVLVP